VSDSNGTIPSQVRASPSTGISVVSYTGTGANGTVGHGLGVAPALVIVKRRTGAVAAWAIGHDSVSSNWNQYLQFTNLGATSDSTVYTQSSTSQVFSVGTSPLTNAAGSNYIAYCFAQVAGFSIVGKYSGNGAADGPFVYCGFVPRLVLIKRLGTDHWVMLDNARDPSNVANKLLLPSTTSAEDARNPLVDFLSNGFKCRSTSSTINGSTGYVFAAFADVPFKWARAR
jgi:hypothetical protein